MTGATGDSIGYSLLNFAHEFGAPEELIFDGAQSQVGPNTLFMKTLRKLFIKYHVSLPRRPNENPSEGGIRELKKRWYRIMIKKKVPQRLWDFGLVWVCETGNFIVSSSRYADGRSGIEIITGETPDISEYIDFGSPSDKMLDSVKSPLDGGWVSHTRLGNSCLFGSYLNRVSQFHTQQYNG